MPGVNIYDFDKTIYDGDSTADFIKFCAVRYKKSLIWALPTLRAFCLYALGRYTKTRFKEKMYGFLRFIPDTDTAVDEFWNRHEKNIFPYYKERHGADDIVISASPEFLLEPICERLGIGRLIASREDKKTGIYTGDNCYGEEKVKRLRTEYGITSCDEFFSDSYSDTPLALIAKKAYIVKKGTLVPWEKK